MKTFIIDTETGGLNPQTDGLLSISIKELGKGNSKTWFIKPQNNKRYTHEALKINGLDLEKLLKEGQNLQQVLDDLVLNWLSYPLTTIIGQNTTFDLSFLEKAFQENNMQLPAIKVLCTRNLGKKHLFRRDVAGHNLKAMFVHFFPNDPLINRHHESEADVLMTEKIFEELWLLEVKNE